MVDKVRPLKIERAADGTQTDPFPIEANPSEDYLTGKGLSIENNDGFLVDKAGNSLQFTDVLSGPRTLKSLHSAADEDFDPTGSTLTATNTQDAIIEAGDTANAAIYPIPLIHNGGVGDGTFLSYSNLTPNAPVIIPVSSTLSGFSFSNAQASADYTLNFRKNTTTGTPFFTVSKTNTQFFIQTLPSPETFNQGDQITIEYVDDGQNANDVALLLFFKAVPL